MISRELVARRAELMAELFIEELAPTFASKPTKDVGWDLLAGFPNGENGTNVFLVQVKGTENAVRETFPIRRDVIDRMSSSNLPGLLLVADVKRNKLYYAWLTRANRTAGVSHTVVQVPVAEIAGRAREALAKALTGSSGVPVPA